MNNYRVIVLEDEPLISTELVGTLNDLGYEVVAELDDPELVIPAIEHTKPDLVFLDINLGHELTGIDIGRKLQKMGKVPFIYLTSFGDRKTIAQASETEPLTYLMKPFNEHTLISAIEVGMVNYHKRSLPNELNLDRINETINGEITRKEFEVLQSIFKGKSNNQIAQQHFVSLNTVKTHIKNLYVKLDVHNRSELLARLRALLSR